MTSDLNQIVLHIEIGLNRLGRVSLFNALQPGLHPEEISRQLNFAGFPDDADIETVYSWRNGTRTADVMLDEICFFPGFYLLSLEDAIANYRAFTSDSRWGAGWLPIFANGGGDFYFVDMKGEPSGVVRHFRVEEIEHPIEFLSLSEMMRTLAAGFDRGVFFVDRSGYLEMEDRNFVELAAECNPGVHWWTA